MNQNEQWLKILRTDLSEEEFNNAALELFNRQARQNPVYRQYLRSLNCQTDQIIHWTEIPALPAYSFCRQRVACSPPIETVQTFQSTRAFGSNPTTHEFASLDFLNASILGGFQYLLPDVSLHRWVSLIPSWEERPHSLLSYMISLLSQEVAQSPVDFLCDERFAFTPEQVFERLIEIASRGEPVFILGTTESFIRLCRTMMDSRVRTALPPDVVLFDTGRSHCEEIDFTRKEFLDIMEESFEVRAPQIYNEYGLTECSSQGYTPLDIELHRFPPWVRARVRHPKTNEMCGPGETGIIDLIDLANVGSVLAVETMDAGIPHHRGLEIVGPYDPGASDTSWLRGVEN